MRTLNDNLLERMRTYIIEYQKEKGLSPSYRNIMRAMDMSSVSLVQRYVLELEKKGLIKRTNLGNIATLPQLRRTGTTMTPLVGEIACGQPVDSFENIEESFPLPKALLLALTRKRKCGQYLYFPRKQTKRLSQISVRLFVITLM